MKRSIVNVFSLVIMLFAASICSGEEPAATRYCFHIAQNTGLAGYFNVNQKFIPGIITLGLTPAFDIRIDQYLHIGAEYMMLWGKPDTTDPARFIMNANIRFRVSVPVHPKVNIEAMIAGGASLWPKEDTLSVLEPTFYEERFGWNTQPGLGVEYRLGPQVSIFCTAGYIANTTVLEEITITHDMLLMSAGTRFHF